MRKAEKKCRDILQYISAYWRPRWKTEFNYTKEPKVIDVGWGDVRTTGFITIPIDILYARIHTSQGLKIQPLEETPHYGWIRDILAGTDDSISRARYYEYSKVFFPEEDPDAQLAAIKKMALAFREQKDIHTAPIVTFLPCLMTDSSYRVVLYDGTHRSIIAKLLGQTTLTCHLVKEKIVYSNFV
jgi:hypothetical protein